MNAPKAQPGMRQINDASSNRDDETLQANNPSTASKVHREASGKILTAENVDKGGT